MSSFSTTRLTGLKLLSTFIKSEKNCSIIEKNIFEKFQNESAYNNVLFECLLSLKNKESVADLLKQIKSGKMNWKNPEFDDVAFKQKEQDDFTIAPFQVEEGVLTCPKCKGCKSFSYSKQTR